MRLTD
ncbi:uncharacterized protein FFNC_15663 [Fusarium fujikuroi]